MMGSDAAPGCQGPHYVAPCIPDIMEMTLIIYLTPLFAGIIRHLLLPGARQRESYNTLIRAQLASVGSFIALLGSTKQWQCNVALDPWSEPSWRHAQVYGFSFPYINFIAPTPNTWYHNKMS